MTWFWRYFFEQPLHVALLKQVGGLRNACVNLQIAPEWVQVGIITYNAMTASGLRNYKSKEIIISSKYFARTILAENFIKFDLIIPWVVVHGKIGWLFSSWKTNGLKQNVLRDVLSVELDCCDFGVSDKNLMWDRRNRGESWSLALFIVTRTICAVAVHLIFFTFSENCNIHYMLISQLYF